MGTVKHREACPICRQKGFDKKGNNKVVYVDDSAYCFACDQHFKSKNIMQTNKINLVKPKRKLLDGVYSALIDRKITIDTCKHFKYKITEDTIPDHIEPFFDSYGVQVKQKIRTQDKRFYNTGDTSNCSFFAQNQYTPNDKLFIVVTEGAIDTMSIAQVQGCKYPVVSLPDGSNSVKKSFGMYCDYLMAFRHIVLAFDNDEAGRNAIKDAMEQLPDAIIHVVTWPEGIKDANDMLMQGRDKELRDLMWSSSLAIPDFLVDLGKIARQSLQPKKIGLSWGFPTLDFATYGIRTKEFILVPGGSSIGKTTLLNQVALQLVFQHKEKVAIVSFEQSPEEVTERLTGQMIKSRLWIPGAQYDVEEAIKMGETLSSKAYAIDTSKGINTIDKLVSKVTSIIKGVGINYLFLDHLTAIASMMRGDERKGIDLVMFTFARMVKDLDCTIILACHLSKPELFGKDGSNTTKIFEQGRRPILTDLRGSQSLIFYPTCIIAPSRDIYKLNSPMTLELLKNRIDNDKVGSQVELSFSRKTGKLEEEKNYI